MSEPQTLMGYPIVFTEKSETYPIMPTFGTWNDYIPPQCCMQDCHRKGATCLRIQFVDENGAAQDSGDVRYICNECLTEIMLRQFNDGGKSDGPEPTGLINW